MAEDDHVLPGVGTGCLLPVPSVRFGGVSLLLDARMIQVVPRTVHAYNLYEI
jgi:hypothetical protein